MGVACTGAEDSKSPKSSKDARDDEDSTGFEAGAVAETNAANGSVSMRSELATPDPGGGGKAGIGGESKDGTSARNACWGLPENEV